MAPILFRLFTMTGTETVSPTQPLTLDIDVEGAEPTVKYRVMIESQPEIAALLQVTV